MDEKIKANSYSSLDFDVDELTTFWVSSTELLSRLNIILVLLLTTLSGITRVASPGPWAGQQHGKGLTANNNYALAA